MPRPRGRRRLGVTAAVLALILVSLGAAGWSVRDDDGARVTVSPIRAPVTPADRAPPNQAPHQTGPNQTAPKQTAPNQTAPNQTAPNQVPANPGAAAPGGEPGNLSPTASRTATERSAAQRVRKRVIPRPRWLFPWRYWGRGRR